MRDLQTMKSDRFKLCNHEFYRRLRIKRLMVHRAQDILNRGLSHASLKDKLFHPRRYLKMVKKFDLYMAIANKMTEEMNYWDSLDKE